MTKEEYENWKKVTALSVGNWMLDQITLTNQKTYLFYKGGESGTYIEIKPSGETTVGFYEGALPHIGEALFMHRHSKMLAGSAEEALRIVVEKMGIPFLMNLAGIKL